MIKSLQKKNRSFLAFLSLASMITLLSLSCTKNFDKYWNEDRSKGGNLYDKVKSIPEFSLFTEALERANYSQFLEKGGSYTIFAPTNEAFSKYLATNNYQSIANVPLEKLYLIVGYHVINSMWYEYNFRDRYNNIANKLFSKNTTYITRSRKYVNVDVAQPTVFKINGIDIVTTLKDIDANNGVIHGISDVMVPLLNLEEILKSDPELSNTTFVKLLKVLQSKTVDALNTFDRNRDGIIDSAFTVTYPLLNAGSNIAVEFKAAGATVANSQGTPAYTTLIIPDDAVLNAYIAPTLAKFENKIELLTPNYIEQVLENYMLADTMMTAANIISRAGINVLRSSNGDALLTTVLRSENDFVKKNIRASNGIVHIIKNTFLPSDREKSALGQAVKDPDFKVFFGALQAAGLVNTYAVSTRTGTFLIPTNAAMKEANVNYDKPSQLQLNSMLLSSSKFQNLLKHNIVNSNLNQAALTGSKTTEFGGATNNVTFTANGSKVNNENGITANVSPLLYTGPNNTGYVYKTDKLLIPPVL
ncbi:MAG: fasciclin domain-containing protein [Pedobacter sp.]